MHRFACVLFALALVMSLMPSYALAAEAVQDGLSAPEADTTSGTDPTESSEQKELVVWDGSVDVSWYNTTDTEFTLNTPAQLAGLAAISSTSSTYEQWTSALESGAAVPSKAEGISYDNFAGKTVKLGADFDLNSIQFDPISDFNVWGGGGAGVSGGTYAGLGWAGTLDGCGHVVYNFKLDGNLHCSENFGGYQGFISGIIKGGVVRNLGITGSLKARVGGGIVGASNMDSIDTVTTSMADWPRIENCWADVDITGNGSGSRGCGGIFGGESDYRSQCSIINCYSLGNVANGTIGSAGGIAGFLDGVISGCVALGSTSGAYTGALVSTLYADGTYDSTSTWAARGSISNCLALEGSDQHGNLYRYVSTATGDPTAVTEGFSTASEIKAGVATLGAAFVEDTEGVNGGYPLLFWQAGLTTTDITEATVTLPASSFPYSGQSVEPQATVVLDGVTLVEGRDYVVSYEGNVEVGTDTAKATVIGVGRYTGTCETLSFSITQIDLSACTISEVTPKWWYGEPVEPSITVTDAAGTKLTEGVDYVVSYANNNAAGTATITITPVGLGTKGQKSSTFILAAASTSLEGSGTEEDPWIISSKGDWQYAAHQIELGNEDYRTGNYKVGADFTLSQGEGEPQPLALGSHYSTYDDEGKTVWVRNYFAGTFDGDGHTITVDWKQSELYASSNTGPFGYVGTYGAKITDLPTVTIKNLTIEGTVNGVGAGGFIGSASSGYLVLENCTNKANVTSTSGYAGGFAATVGICDVKDCVNEGSVTGPYVGGIVGQQNFTDTAAKNYTVTFENCVNKGSLNGVTYYAAGICAQTQMQSPIVVSRCVNTGSVTAKYSAGGIFGYSSVFGGTAKLSVIGCYNSGSVTASQYVGGVVCVLPYADALVSSCYNVGTITCTGNAAAYVSAGIVGACVANASGVAGSKQVITSCYNAGELVGARKAGILGYLKQQKTSFDISGVYLEKDGVPSIGGFFATTYIYTDASVAVSEDELKAVPDELGPAFFEDSAELSINGGYPVLWWQAGVDDIDLSSAVVSAIEDQSYTGSAIVPSGVTLTLDGTELVQGRDFDVFVTDNVEVGTATITAKGIGMYSGQATSTFKIVPQNVSKCTFTVSQNPIWCSADNPAEPALSSAKNAAGTTLKQGTDYELSYANNTSTGTATVTITGIGNYTGSTSLTYVVYAYEVAELEGSGTVNDPYIISTTADWQYVASRMRVDAGAYAGAAYKLGNDLELVEQGDEPSLWAWGVSEGQAFYGIFDGDGHTIAINGRTSALFDYLNGATVKNLTVTGTAKLTNSAPFAKCVYGDTTFENCTSDVAITASNMYVSGLAFRVYGNASFSNCQNYSDIVAAGASYTGLSGFVVDAPAGSSVAFDNCANFGDISTSGSISSQYNGVVGGFVAQATSSDITLSECFNAGTIKAGYSAALFVGSAKQTNLTVTDCYNVGTLEILYKYNANAVGAGSIVGTLIPGEGNAVAVSNFYNAGSLVQASGNGTWAYGSLFGYVDPSGTQAYDNLYWKEGSASEASGSALTDIVLASTCLSEGDMKAQGADGLAAKLGVAFSDDTAAINDGYPILGAQRIDISEAHPVVIKDQPYTGAAIEPGILMLYAPSGSLVPNFLKQGEDFEVIYSNNVELGTATAKIVGVGSYAGTTSLEFNIVAGSLSDCSIEAVPDQVMKGEPVKPELVVTTTAGVELVAGEDYDVIYRNNDAVGTATVVLVGKGNFEGQAQVSFNVVAGSLESAEIVGVEDFYDYTGDAIEIDASLVDEDGKTLVEGVDYEAAITDSDGNPVSEVKAKGSYAITFTGIGSYTGSVSKDFSVGVYLTVYTQEGPDGTPVVAKEFTKAELEALKAADAQPISGMYYKNNVWNVVTASEYVTVEALLAGAGLEGQFVEGTSLKATSGTFAAEATFEEIQAQSNFYPDLAKDGTQATEARTGQVPVLALKGNSSVAQTTVGAAEQANVENADTTTAPRLIYGVSADQVGPEPSAAGKRYVSACDSITLILPEPVIFTVNYRIGDEGDVQIAKQYTASDLKALAQEDRDPVSGMFFKSNVWNITSSDYYVTLEELFADAGIADLWGDGSKLIYGGDDPNSPEKGASTFVYADLMAMNKFFPDAQAGESPNPANSVAAPPVLTITEYSGLTSTTASAADVQAANLEKASTQNFPRLIYGISEEMYTLGPTDGGGMGSLVGGWRYWSANKYLTIVAPAPEPVDISGASISGVEASYEVAEGGSVAPEPVVTLDGAALTAGTDYEVSILDARGNAVEAAAEEGQYTLVVTGIGDYAGTASVAFSVTRPAPPAPEPVDISGASISGVEASYEVAEGGSVAPEPVVTLDGAALTAGTDYEVSILDARGNAVEAAAEEGQYTLVVTGIGDYAGTASVAFSVTRPAPEPPAPVVIPSAAGMFVDVDADAALVGGFDNLWYAEGLSYCVYYGILTGYTDGSNCFGPYDSVTRGQVATILWRMDGEPAASASVAAFPDVDYSLYYGDAIRWARESGVIKGYDTGSVATTEFRPEQEVSRQELAVMLANYAAYKQGVPSTSNCAKLDAMPDSGEVAAWAREAVGWCIDNGLLSGVEQADGTRTIEPEATAQRAQIAKMAAVLHGDVLDMG